jgi:hypothetical protein
MLYERSALAAERFLSRIAEGSPCRDAHNEAKRGAESAASWNQM